MKRQPKGVWDSAVAAYLRASGFPGTPRTADLPQAGWNRRAGEVPLPWASECQGKSVVRQSTPPESCVLEGQGGQEPAQQSTAGTSKSETVTWGSGGQPLTMPELCPAPSLSRLFGSDCVQPWRACRWCLPLLKPLGAVAAHTAAWPSRTQLRSLASTRLTSFSSVSCPFCCYRSSSTSCSVWVLVLFPVSFSCHFSN